MAPTKALRAEAPLRRARRLRATTTRRKIRKTAAYTMRSTSYINRRSFAAGRERVPHPYPRLPSPHPRSKQLPERRASGQETPTPKGVGVRGTPPFAKCAKDGAPALLSTDGLFSSAGGSLGIKHVPFVA